MNAVHFVAMLAMLGCAPGEKDRSLYSGEQVRSAAGRTTQASVQVRMRAELEAIRAEFGLTIIESVRLAQEDRGDDCALIEDGMSLYEWSRALSPRRVDSILDGAATRLAALRPDEQASTLGKHRAWCSVVTAIKIISDLSPDGSFAEAVAELNGVSDLLEKYVRQPGQGWFSLSGRQVNCLMYDVASRLSTAGGEARAKFVHDYSEWALSSSRR